MCKRFLFFIIYDTSKVSNSIGNKTRLEIYFSMGACHNVARAWINDEMPEGAFVVCHIVMLRLPPSPFL